jgi:hypothetical protein
LNTVNLAMIATGLADRHRAAGRESMIFAGPGWTRRQAARSAFIAGFRTSMFCVKPTDSAVGVFFMSFSASASHVTERFPKEVLSIMTLRGWRPRSTWHEATYEGIASRACG